MAGFGKGRKLQWYVAGARVQSRVHRAVRSADILNFFRMMTTLITGGTPLLEGIKVASTQSESSDLRQCLQQIARLMEAGASFHQAAGQFPRIFEDYWVQLIRTGELTGQLHSVMERLVQFLETTAGLQRKIMGALAYPAILACISVVALFVMMWKVVPTFTAFFKDFGGHIPAVTQYVIGLSQFFEHNGLYFVIFGPAVIWAIRRYLQSETGNRLLTNILLVTPLAGETMVELSMQKFCSNLALLLKSGTDLLDGMVILQTLYRGFPAYKEALAQVHYLLIQGEGLSVSLEQTHLFTPLVTNMIKVGEASGQLVPVLEQLDIYYATRAQTKIMALTSLMEPVIVIFMGGVIGTLLSAIYIPMFNMSGGGRH